MKSPRSRRTKSKFNFPFTLTLTITAIAAFSFGLGAYVSHASVTLNGSGVTASSTSGNFLELTSSTTTLFGVDNQGNVGANEFYGSTVSTTPAPNLSFTSSGGLNVNAGGTNQNLNLNPTGTGATIVTSLADKGGQVFNVKAYGAAGNGTTDDTAAINGALLAAYEAGGGVIYFPPGTYLIAGALTIPNDGAAHPNQPAYIIEGAGMGANGSAWGANLQGASTLDLTEASDTVGKIDTRGAGFMEIKNLALEDTNTDSIPFIFTTNTTIHVEDVSFTSSMTGTSNTQDAIILGSTNPTDIHTGLADAPFQGYGTVVENCFFNRVRHAVVGNTYANGIQIVNNTVGAGSGSAISGDAPFVFIGSSSGSSDDSGDVINNNLVEETNYYYAVRLSQYDENFTMLANSGYDGGPNTTGVYYFGTGSDTEDVSCGQTPNAVCVDPTSPGASGGRYFSMNMSADSNGSQIYLGGTPSFIKGAFLTSNQCLDMGFSSNCIYTNGIGVTLFRYSGNDVLQVSSNGVTASSLQTGSASGPTWTTGTSTPSGSCTTGSLYSNASGTSGSTLYDCVGGAWVDVN